MAKSISVSDNIRVIEEAIRRHTEQVGLIQKEILRLEGSLSVFKNLSVSGVEFIELPTDEIINREVIDTSPD